MATRTRRPRPYRAPPPDTSPCHPTGDLTPLHGEVGNDGHCACGDPVTQEWNEQARDWQYRSHVDGTIVRAVEKPPVSPHIMAQMRDNPKITPKMLEEYEASHWGAGCLWELRLHWHRIVDCPKYTGECPECHGWPMQAVAHGWRCRVTSRMHLAGDLAPSE